jgi:hypothetical protein
MTDTLNLTIPETYNFNCNGLPFEIRLRQSGGIDTILDPGKPMGDNIIL